MEQLTDGVYALTETIDRAAGELHAPDEQFTLDMAEASQSVARLSVRAIDCALWYHGSSVAADDDRIGELAESIEL